jgi:hypothetical protein
MSKRKMLDCRRFPSEHNCTITILGTEEEVLDLAVYHAADKHGHTDSPDLREQLRALLTDAQD